MDGVLEIYVRPGSSRPGVGGAFDGRTVVRVHARAIDGQANAAVVAAVGELLGVPRSAITIAVGAAGRRKRLVIRGMPTHEVRRRIDDAERGAAQPG